MTINKNVIKKINRIEFSKYEPTSEFTLWAKPEADNKYGYYVFNNGSWQLLTTGEGGGSGEGDTIIINIPDISGNISTFTNDSGYITSSDVPNELKDLSGDSTHRLVTDTEKSTWNGKQDAINDLDSIRAGAALGATALQSETDPVFTASAAHGITSTDISNWNSKTSNVGTITGVTMNGASKGTSGVVNLGNVVTSVNNQTGAVTIATGDANIIEGITVNGTSVNPTSKVVALTIPTITFKQW